ncbi:MAG: hypothetical protein J0M12_04535 [Deltaproteobacteria bacterium]|nr:hypothetical protein [Deltaproteobacteria bacterium]
MCMYHAGLRVLSQWWRDHAVDGVQERELALSLVTLPAKERGHSFLDWFAANGADGQWQVRVLRKMALACNAGLMDAIRDLPDERWEWGIEQVLPHLQAPVPTATEQSRPPTLFHEMILADGLTVDEILAIGVLQGVRPRTTCLQWYDDHKGESGTGYPIPLLEKLAGLVFKGSLLDTLEALPASDDRASKALTLLRAALREERSCCSSGNAPPPRRKCCG